MAGVRVGLVDGQIKIFPTLAETETGLLDMVVAGTEDSIMMVEGGASELSEEQLVEAILLAHQEIKKLVALQKELIAQVRKEPKPEYVAKEKDPALVAAVRELVADRIHDISFNGQKAVRYKGVHDLLAEYKPPLKKNSPIQELKSNQFHRYRAG